MAWNDSGINEKRGIFKKNKKTGKENRVGTELHFNDGEIKKVLTPSGKAAKYATELREQKKFTNDGIVKKQRLSDVERAYRSGYLDSQRDSTDTYLAKTDPKKLSERKAERAKRKSKQN